MNEATIADLTEAIWENLGNLAPGDGYYRDLLIRIGGNAPEVTVGELCEAIIRVQTRAEAFQEGPDTLQ